jgi:hypothetical protein
MEELVKHAFVGVVALIALSNEAMAQGVEVHTRWGGSGSHVTLSPQTQVFGYEATVSGATVPYEVKLQVLHNGVLKFTNSRVVPNPIPPFFYSYPVGMGTWGLAAGDSVTFVLTVTDIATGAVLATHNLIGEVAGT